MDHGLDELMERINTNGHGGLAPTPRSSIKAMQNIKITHIHVQSDSHCSVYGVLGQTVGCLDIEDVSNYVTDKDGVIKKDDYMEVDEDHDFPISIIRNRIIENVTKSQEKAKEVVDVDEKTKTDEEPATTVMKSIAKFVADRVKEKKKEKKVPHKFPMKDIVTKNEKTSKGNSATKRR
ncbi:hypothetical protein KIW84_042752 [Lathyrus oleraceus]|uniref:Uncharacterized protein n=1 Tax=Pisum sativum TaxID=3888 RepID=A0A9D4XBU6_PEA|nr:hypothetical protein KIW84_042752 [Pisum sativum]